MSANQPFVPNEYQQHVIDLYKRGDLKGVTALFNTEVQSHPLLLAAGLGNVAEVERLLTQNTNPNETSRYGFSPLNVAIMEGQADVVATLLRNGADPQALYLGMNMLQLWAMSGTTPQQSRAVAEQLLPHFNINANTADWHSPLRLATINKDEEKVRYLLAKGAQNLPGPDGMTPAGIAFQNRHYALGRLIVGNAEPNELRRWTAYESIAESLKRLRETYHRIPKIFRSLRARTRAKIIGMFIVERNLIKGTYDPNIITSDSALLNTPVNIYNVTQSLSEIMNLKRWGFQSSSTSKTLTSLLTAMKVTPAQYSIPNPKTDPTFLSKPLSGLSLQTAAIFSLQFSYHRLQDSLKSTPSFFKQRRALCQEKIARLNTLTQYIQKVDKNAGQLASADALLTHQISVGRKVYRFSDYLNLQRSSKNPKKFSETLRNLSEDLHVEPQIQI